MGYTTTFTGSITITPPLPPSAVEEINTAFDPFTANTEPVPASDGTLPPGYYCDWRARQFDDHTELSWNGAEKSYQMDRWLAYLLSRFLPDTHTAVGVVEAQGEDPTDRWRMVVTAGKRAVEVQRGEVVYK